MEMPNWPGMKPSTVTGTGGFLNAYFSGVAFPPCPKGADGKDDPEAKTLRRSLTQDMQMNFTPNSEVKRLEQDAAYDIGLLHAVFTDYSLKRKDLTLYEGIHDGAKSVKVLRMDQEFAFDQNHPGRVVLRPASQRSNTTQPAAPPVPPPRRGDEPSKFPFAKAQGLPPEKMERARQELIAKGRGEGPMTPTFWGSQRNTKQPLERQRTQLLHIIKMARGEVEELQQQDDYDRFHKQGQYAPGYQEDDDVEVDRDDDGYHTAPSGPDESRSYENEELRHGVHDPERWVTEDLARLNAVASQGSQFAVREHTNDYRDQRNTRGEQRNDSQLFQGQRNSANNNPGKLYEQKKVAFAQGVCIKHQHNKCPFASNPADCRWSHDADACAEDAKEVAAVSAAREAERKSKPGTKAATVAAIGANTRQQMEQQQSSGLPQRASSSEDDQQEE